jgi:hypothetical protein
VSRNTEKQGSSSDRSTVCLAVATSNIRTRDGQFGISDQAIEGWTSSIESRVAVYLEVLTGLVSSNALASTVALDERHIANTLIGRGYPINPL